MMKVLFLTLLMALNFSSIAEITLEGDNGGRLDGSKWSSSELKGKNIVHVLFYVDPDEKDLNEHVSKKLKTENFDRTKFQSVAVINMAATWLPNFAIESSLKKKQEQYPDTLYLKDFKKVLVDKWELKDDSSNIVLFNTKGEIIYKILGKASDEQASELIAKIKSELTLIK